MSVRELALARQAKLDAAAAADEAERADAAAWAKALKNGWSEADLREVGFDAPSRRSPGRPRRRPTRQREDLLGAAGSDAAAGDTGATGPPAGASDGAEAA